MPMRGAKPASNQTGHSPSPSERHRLPGLKWKPASASGPAQSGTRVNLENVVYCFPCPGCGELIRLPRQSPLGAITTTKYLCSNVWPIRFLCTQLASALEVTQAAIQLASQSTSGQTPRTASLWEIDCECVLESCGKRHSIYTNFARGAEPAMVSRALLKAFPSLACLGGHLAKLHRDHMIAFRID
jgi:hypothetical protein